MTPLKICVLKLHFVPNKGLLPANQIRIIVSSGPSKQSLDKIRFGICAIMGSIRSKALWTSLTAHPGFFA
jgi:hypothetical protein